MVTTVGGTLARATYPRNPEDHTTMAELSEDQIQQITDALAAGRKIDAIKIYREATGMGLKEAKDWIDALIATLKEKEPERFSQLGVSKGCASAALLVATLGFGTAAAMAWGVAAGM